jgi:hypothetical protein
MPQVRFRSSGFMARQLAPQICRCALLLAATSALAAWPAPVSAQQQVVAVKAAPHDGYWQCFGPFLDGDFREAGQEFREASRSGLFNIDHVVGGPWIDSICYHTMLGRGSPDGRSPQRLSSTRSH